MSTVGVDDTRKVIEPETGCGVTLGEADGATEVAADGSALAGTDYTSQAGTLPFTVKAKQTTQGMTELFVDEESYVQYRSRACDSARPSAR